MLLLVITFYFGLLYVIAFQNKVKLRVLNLGLPLKQEYAQ